MLLFFDTEENPVVVKPVQIFLHPAYRIEHLTKLLIHAFKIPSISLYLTQAEAELYQITFTESGQVVDRNGVFLENGNYLVTMTGDIIDDELENVIIYASRRDRTAETCVSLPGQLPSVINHPNFIQGEPAIFTGHFEVNDTLLSSVDNNSGHYKPQLSQLLPAMAYIIKKSNSEVVEFNDFSTTPTTVYHLASDEDYESVIINKIEDGDHDCNEEPRIGYAKAETESKSDKATRFNSNPLRLGRLFAPGIQGIFKPAPQPEPMQTSHQYETMII